MPNRALWTSGTGQGLTWGMAIAGADLAGLAAGSTVLSSVATIRNDLSLDLYADVSVELTLPSATPVGLRQLAVYLVPLLGDGATFGDGSMAGGGVLAAQPAYAPAGIIPLGAVSTSLFAGIVQGIMLPPGQFRWALFNGSGCTLSATPGNNVVMYRTYNLNLNG